MKDLLVGSTGFVGGNVAAAHSFDALCHSTDVDQTFGSCPDVCVYAGIPSAMFLSNKNPKADLEIMRVARENMRRINPKKLVLISTIAVYLDSRGKKEPDAELLSALPAYGYNRLLLEQWVREDFSDALIVRLPALYGIGLKKNFLFDLHTITPAMLRPEKYAELSEISEEVRSGYSVADNGFYKLNGMVPLEVLKAWFSSAPFNALCFTDSRSRYQFYNLSRLWKDIETALSANLTCLNLTPPPLSAEEVYEAVMGNNTWHNELPVAPFNYDLRSNYASLLGGENGYLCSKEDSLRDISKFMHSWN